MTTTTGSSRSRLFVATQRWVFSKIRSEVVSSELRVESSKCRPRCRPDIGCHRKEATEVSGTEIRYGAIQHATSAHDAWDAQASGGPRARGVRGHRDEEVWRERRRCRPAPDHVSPGHRVDRQSRWLMSLHRVNRHPGPKLLEASADALFLSGQPASSQAPAWPSSGAGFRRPGRGPSPGGFVGWFVSVRGFDGG